MHGAPEVIVIHCGAKLHQALVQLVAVLAGSVLCAHYSATLEGGREKRGEDLVLDWPEKRVEKEVIGFEWEGRLKG